MLLNFLAITECSQIRNNLIQKSKNKTEKREFKRVFSIKPLAERHETEHGKYLADNVSASLQWSVSEQSGYFATLLCQSDCETESEQSDQLEAQQRTSRNFPDNNKRLKEMNKCTECLLQNCNWRRNTAGDKETREKQKDSILN